MPFTSIKWRPLSSQDNVKSQTVIATTSSDGYISHWHLNTGKCIHSIKEDNDNNLFCLDFQADATHFAVAGSDSFVYVYDE